MAYDGVIKTQSSEVSRVAATNITTAGTSIANPACTAAGPTGDGIILMGSPSGAYSSNGLLLVPFGVGSATNTFLMSVFAWDFVHPKTAQNAGMWVAWLLASFTCTLCTVAGLAGGEVDATQLFCDTITLGKGNANVSNEIVSPTGNVIASIVLDTKGAKRVQTSFVINASATSCNTLYRKL